MTPDRFGTTDMPGVVPMDPVHIRRYLLVLAAGWTAVICASLMWVLHSEWREATAAAHEGALATYEKDLVYRRWNARHGGVYVPVTEATPPNPYLWEIPERDVKTPSGRMLTLVNPAYMTRQVHEMGGHEMAAQSHLASLDPVNPKNMADDWETFALQMIAAGKNEVSSVVETGGRRYLRLIRPLVAEPVCLDCHASRGCKQGDIRGGISVSVALSPYEAIARARMLPISLGHGGLWLFGIAGISLGSRGLRKRILSQVRSQREQEFHLRIAHAIQQRFYRASLAVQGLDVAGTALSATYTGGDYFDFIRMPDGALLIAVGDVSGHGFGSALVMAETRAYLRSFASIESDLGSLLTAVNRTLAADLDGARFVTLFLARIEPGNHSLRFAGAAHLPCYLLSCEGAIKSVLNSSGPPAGLFPDAEFRTSPPIHLHDGETLLLLTDGITEARNESDVEFGSHSAVEFIRRHAEKTAAELVDGICQAAKRHSGTVEQHDDITCVVCRVRA